MSDKYPGGFVTANAPAGFSVAFDGTGDRVDVASNAAFGVGTGDFTVEGWLYWVADGSNAPTVFSIGNVNSGGSLNIFVDGTYGLYVRLGTSDTRSTAAYNMLGKWIHFAAVRTSGVIALYYNGVSQAVTTSGASNSITATAPVIGWCAASAGNQGYLNGYISNLRYSNTAVYSANFTPPTQLFKTSSAILLACQSPTIIDNSNNAFALTPVGNTVVSNFTPFAAYQGFNPALGAAAGGVWTLDEAAYYQNNRQWPIYDPYFNQTTLMLHGNGTNGAQNNTFLDSSTNNFTITRNGNTTQGSFTPFSQTGWSTYFNGSSYLTVTNAATQMAFGTGDWQIEMFLYPTSLPSTDNVPFDGRVSNGAYPVIIVKGTSASPSQKVVYYVNTSVAITSDATLPLNAWSHVMVSRVSGTTRMFINGVVQSGTYADSTTYLGGNSQPWIGANAGVAEFWNGYISNVRILKGSGTSASFTPSTTPLTAVTNTVVLTCQSNRFVDNSASNLTITAGSAPSVQAFSPFVPTVTTPTTYSGFFGATTGKLSIASMTALGSDFTVEGWINPSAFADYNTIFDNRTSDTDANGFALGLTSAKKIYFYTNASFQLTTTTALNASTWYHIALVRSGSGSGNVKIYINGIADATTATYTTSFTRTAASIACDWNTRSNLQFFGCISNFRTLTTALYTANFTPPTAPLTAIANTTLLTCQSSTFIDNSGNSVAITVSGTAYPVTSPTPFPAKVDTTTLNSAYSTSLIGGSAYFDGTTDYLNLASNAAFSLGTGDFTIETFAYYSSFTQVDAIAIINWDGGTWSANNWSLHLDHASQRGRVTFWVNNINVGSPILSSGTALVANNWYHIAVTRSGSTWRLFINGVIFASTTSSASIDGGTNPPLYIGGSGTTATQAFNGYLSGMRLVKGTALYTQAFTPPLTPPTAVSGTSLLTNFTNGAIFDNTAKNVLETVGNAQISTTQSKWGGSSMYFDGTGDYLKARLNDPIVFFGSGNWTVECWVYLNNTSGQQGIVVGQSDYANASNASYSMYVTGSSAGDFFYGSSFVSLSSPGLSSNVWTHCAWVRNGSTITFYRDGTSITSVTIGTNTLNNGTTNPMCVGGANSGANILNGYIDDLRITKGVARYTANFTPPTSQLQDQ